MSFTGLKISFNGFALLAVLVSSWVLSAFLFLKIKDDAKDYALFANSLMWLSPFVAELLVLLSWDLKGVFDYNVGNLVLGGAGFSDFLFLLGFATLIATTPYAIVELEKTVDKQPRGKITPEKQDNILGSVFNIF